METHKPNNANFAMIPALNEMVLRNQIEHLVDCLSPLQQTVYAIVMMVTIHLSPPTASNVFFAQQSAVNAPV